MRPFSSTRAPTTPVRLPGLGHGRSCSGPRRACPTWRSGQIREGASRVGRRSGTPPPDTGSASRLPPRHAELPECHSQTTALPAPGRAIPSARPPAHLDLPVPGAAVPRIPHVLAPAAYLLACRFFAIAALPSIAPTAISGKIVHSGQCERPSRRMGRAGRCRPQPRRRR